MKKFLTPLLAAMLLGAWSAWSIADDDDRRRPGIRHIVDDLRQDVDQNAADIQNNAARIQQNADKAAANMEAIQNNAANIADNFSQIQGNRMDIMDLDARVTELESAGPPGGGGGGRTFVDVDCNDNADALNSPPISGNFPDDTTFNIVGRCNGPVYVTEDRVRFVGVTPDAALVLPAGIPNAFDGTIFGDGAHDLRIENLLIDASAWSTPAAEGSDAAGVYARNAFIRVSNVNIIGGLWGINPFRNSIVRLQGNVNISQFVNAGISVGDQSLITTRGPVNISSTVVGGSYLTGVEVYRQGIVDFRRGLTVDVPPTDFDAGIFTTSILATHNSHVRLRGAGFVNLRGEVLILSSSTLSMDAGNIDGVISIRDGAVAQMFSVTQAPLPQDLPQVNDVRKNSSLLLVNSNVQGFSISFSSILEVNGGSFGGGNVSEFSSLQSFDANINDGINARKPSTLTVFGGTAVQNFLICDEDTVNVDTGIFVAPAGLVDVCP